MCVVKRHQQARSVELSLPGALDRSTLLSNTHSNKGSQSWADCEAVNSVKSRRDELDRQIEELEGIAEVRRSTARGEGDYLEQAQKQDPLKLTSRLRALEEAIETITMCLNLASGMLVPIESELWREMTRVAIADLALGGQAEA